MKHITRELWEGSFEAIAEVGDSVDESIVDEMADCVPPATFNSHMVQMGEAYSHMDDGTGKWKAMYITFTREGNMWTYRGLCFRGSDVNMYKK